MARRAAGAPFRPFQRYFNRRFEDVHQHLDNEAATRVSEAAIRLDDTLRVLRDLHERVATDVEVISELTLTQQRIADRLGERVDELMLALDRLPNAAPDDPPPVHG